MRTAVILTITTLLTSAALFVGCGDETGSSTSSGSSSSSGASSSSGSGACFGNETEWKKATAEPIACSTNADCCAIVNGCTSAVQVVGASKLSLAKANWPYCESECVFCTAPAVEVECLNGQCVGYQIPDEEMPSQDLRKDHCGVDGPPLMKPTPASSFVCAP